MKSKGSFMNDGCMNFDNERVEHWSKTKILLAKLL